MKFRFRFASLLKVRKHKEHIERQKLGMLLEQKNALVREIEEEQESILSSFAFTADRLATTSSIRMGYEFMHDRKKAIIKLQQELEEVNAQLEKQQKALTEANRKVKMIEMIEAKDFEEFTKKQNAIEQLQLNEVAMQIFNRTN